jgi:hypothetical protein
MPVLSTFWCPIVGVVSGQNLPGANPTAQFATTSSTNKSFLRQMTPCLTQGILVKDGVINEQSCDSLLKTFFKKSASAKNILE